jgi:Zn-dependent peptidase ImmA (M78 family)
MGETVAQIRTRARGDAASVLAAHWTTRTVPVDPVLVARSLGVDVFTAQLGTDTYGMLVGDAGKATIYLDNDQAPARMRITCAQEVGHYIDRGNELLDGMAVVGRRSEEGRGTADQIYANEFATSLLMPDSELRTTANKMNSISTAAYFGVSLDALRYRRKLMSVSSSAEGWPDDDTVPDRIPATPSSDALKSIETGSQRDASHLPRETPQSQFGDSTPAAEIAAATSKFFPFQPFMNYFFRLSNAQYPESMSCQERVRRHRVESGRLYSICVVADLVIMALAISIVLALAGALLYRALLG